MRWAIQEAVLRNEFKMYSNENLLSDLRLSGAEEFPSEQRGRNNGELRP